MSANIVFDFCLVSDGYFSPSEVKTVTASSSFDQVVERWSCIVTSYYGPLGHSCLFDLYELSDDRQTLNGRVVQAVLAFLKERYSAHSSNTEIFNSLCDPPRSELLRYILSAIVGGENDAAKDHARVRFDRSGLFLKYTVDLGERQSSREAWLKSMASKVATASLTKDRKWEADCLVNEIGLAPDGLVLAVACPVLFEDEKHRCIAEIDGVFVRVDDCQLDVTFLEAKNRGKRATTLAKQDLEEKLKTLKLHQAIPNVCKREGYAAVTLSFGP